MLLGSFLVKPFWKILWCSHKNCVYKVFVDDGEKTQETKAFLVWQQTAAEKCYVLFKQSHSFRYCHITYFILLQFIFLQLKLIKPNHGMVLSIPRFKGSQIWCDVCDIVASFVRTFWIDHGIYFMQNLNVNLRKNGQHCSAMAGQCTFSVCPSWLGVIVGRSAIKAEICVAECKENCKICMNHLFRMYFMTNLYPVSLLCICCDNESLSRAFQ